MDANRVYLVLHDFELYLSPPNCTDSINPQVQMKIVPVDLPCGDHIFFAAKSKLAPLSLLLRSAFKVAVSCRSGKEYLTSISSLAMMTLLLRSGTLDIHSPAYRADIREWVEVLSPRGQPMTERQQMQQLAAKAISNCFGKVGRFESFMLDMGSFLNHSCVPNAAMLIDTGLCEASIVAISEIDAGVQILISYIPFPIDSIAARRNLLSAYDFVCLCEYCQFNAEPSIYYALATTQSLNSNHCWYCGENGQIKCNRCKHANYCSKTCLQLNRSTHLKICKRLAQPTKLEAIPTAMVPINSGLSVHVY